MVHALGVAKAKPTPTPAPKAIVKVVPSPIFTPVVSPSVLFPSFHGNSLLPLHPALASNSAAMIATAYADSSSISMPNANDAQSSCYEAKLSDPLVTVWVNTPSPVNGQHFRIPIGAVAAGNSDGHASMLAPDGCTILDTNNFGDGAGPTRAGQTSIRVGTAGIINQCTGNGFEVPGPYWSGATAGGASSRLGRSPVSELATGVIFLALEVLPACTNGAGSIGQSTFSSVFPCRTNGPGIPYGAYVWSDVNPAQLATISGLDNATKMLCTALNAYGGVNSDINASNNGLSINGLWNEIGTQGAAYTAWANANMHLDQTQPQKCFPAVNGEPAGWQYHFTFWPRPEAFCDRRVPRHARGFVISDGFCCPDSIKKGSEPQCQAYGMRLCCGVR